MNEPSAASVFGRNDAEKVGVLDERAANVPSRCVEACWTALDCPECGRRMNPRGRSAPLEMECPRDPCPADDSMINPRHLWDANDEERWRFYPEEAPVDAD